MLENGEAVLKLKDFLKKKGLQLPENKIEEIAQNLFRLGLFLVRRKVEENSITSINKLNNEKFKNVS